MGSRSMGPHSGGFERKQSGVGIAIFCCDRRSFGIVSADNDGATIPASEMLISLSGSNAGKMGPASMPWHTLVLCSSRSSRRHF